MCALQNHPAAKIESPTASDIEFFVSAVGRKCPVMGEERVWAACDGLKLPVQQPSDWMEQNPLYNGWKSATFVNSVFVFSPDGLIRVATINAPGSWHDSSMADCGVCQKMERLHTLH